ncbi:transposase [Puniceicoccaceae bacterium K14]|nr:transposase [Puniceicoccaceae bacterium K14]
MFTLPYDLNPVIRQNREKCLSLLFRSAAETLQAFSINNLKARLGITAVLHTWGQTLCEHYHLHAIVTGGGISLDERRWIEASGKRLFAVKALSHVFRAKYLAGLQALYAKGELEFHGQAQRLAKAKAFAQLLGQSARKKWVVYSKMPFGGPDQVLKYLSLYTHRAGIADGRILSVQEKTLKMRFAYKAYADGSKAKKIRLGLDEFLRRFCLHVLPPRFVKIRHYGILSNSQRKALVQRSIVLIQRIRDSAKEPQAVREPEPPAEQANQTIQQRLPRCPWCGSDKLTKIGTLRNGFSEEPAVLYQAIASG